MAVVKRTYIDDAGCYRTELVEVVPKKKPKVRYEWNYRGQAVRAFDTETGKKVKDSSGRRGWF